MALRTYQLTLAATQQRLSDVYGGAVGVANPVTDIPYRQVTLQSEAAASFIGMDTTVATNKYGYTLASGGAVTLGGGFDTGPIKLSDYYVVGAGATLHVTGIPF